MTSQTVNLKETYFGFTSNLKPMQAGRIEKSLDKLIRYDGKVITHKEWIYQLLLIGLTPNFEENYTYYSSRTGEYTKPKTLYKLSYENGSYHELNKTYYDYANYLLDNNFINPQIAAEYIQSEIDQQAEQLKLEQEEREHKQIERQMEEDERKQKHLEKRKQWKEAGTKLMTDNVKSMVKEAFNEHREEIKNRYTHNTDIDTLIENTIELFTEQLGNQEFIKSNISYIFHDDINRTNLNNKIYMSIYKRIFNAAESDSKQTLTAKVKAFYENREYKGSNSKPIELTDFYILNGQTKQFELKQGEKKTINGLVCYIYKNERGYWTVTESRTGMSLGSPQTNKQEAINNAKQGIEKAGERLENLIQSSINRFGISPLYKEVEAV